MIYVDPVAVDLLFFKDRIPRRNYNPFYLGKVRGKVHLPPPFLPDSRPPVPPVPPVSPVPPVPPVPLFPLSPCPPVPPVPPVPLFPCPPVPPVLPCPPCSPCPPPVPLHSQSLEFNMTGSVLKPLTTSTAN